MITIIIFVIKHILLLNEYLDVSSLMSIRSYLAITYPMLVIIIMIITIIIEYIY